MSRNLSISHGELNSVSRLRETRPEQEWSNGTEFSVYSDFPEKRVYSKRIPKFSKTFSGIFTIPFNFGPEISEFFGEWKASMYSNECMSENEKCCGNKNPTGLMFPQLFAVLTNFHHECF